MTTQGVRRRLKKGLQFALRKNDFMIQQAIKPLARPEIYSNETSNLTEVASSVTSLLVPRSQLICINRIALEVRERWRDEEVLMKIQEYFSSRIELSLPFPGSAKRIFVSISVSLRHKGEREKGEPYRREERGRSAKLSFLLALKLFLNNLEQDKSHCYVPWKTNSRSTHFVLWIISHLLQNSDREIPGRSPPPSPAENLGQLIFLMLKFLPELSTLPGGTVVWLSRVNSMHQLFQLYSGTCTFPFPVYRMIGPTPKATSRPGFGT